MTYREALTAANTAYAVAWRVRNGQLIPADEQIIIQNLLANLKDAVPDPPGPGPVITPPAPPTGETEAPLLAKVA